METSSTQPSSKRRAKFFFGGSVVFVSVCALLFWAMATPNATAFYLTPTELLERGSLPIDESYRLNGTVVPDSIERDGLTTAFTVTDGKTEVDVVTDVAVPDTFKDRSEIVATGSFDGSTFTAVQVLAKCPSKFKARADDA